MDAKRKSDKVSAKGNRMTPEKKKKLDAMIADLQAVAMKHNMVVDQYATENGPTKYYFKLQSEDVEANIDDVFLPVYHGPTRPLNAN